MIIRACSSAPSRVSNICTASRFHFPSSSFRFSSCRNTPTHGFLLPLSNSFLKISHPTSPSVHTVTLESSSSWMACPKSRGRALFCAKTDGGSDREILVQHLLIAEDNARLIVDLQMKIVQGTELSDLAMEYSICPSKENGGMLGWVKKGQMVPEFEQAAFGAALNKVVRCKTKFGWHLLQVLAEREAAVLGIIEPEELHLKMQDEDFVKNAQLIDVREPDEVERASLRGFKVLPLRQFGTWGPRVTDELDPEKDTYVMCHHGMRSTQVAQWLLTQGFKNVFNVAGGIHAYAVKADSSIPTY